MMCPYTILLLGWVSPRALLLRRWCCCDEILAAVPARPLLPLTPTRCCCRHRRCPRLVKRRRIHCNPTQSTRLTTVAAVLVRPLLPPTLCCCCCAARVLSTAINPLQSTHHSRHESSSEDSDDDEGYYEPVLAPLSLVDWSHEPLLALGDCDLPQRREWTLADIGKEVRFFSFLPMKKKKRVLCPPRKTPGMGSVFAGPGGSIAFVLPQAIFDAERPCAVPGSPPPGPKEGTIGQR